MRTTTQSIALLSAAVLAVLLFTAAPARAVLLAYDPFLVGDDPSAGEYKAGSEASGVDVIGGQNPVIGPTAFYSGGWIQSGGDASVVKSIGSLAFPDFQPGLGGQVEETVEFNCCSFGRNGRAFTTTLGSGGGSTVLYQSFIIDFGAQGTDSPTDGLGAPNFGKRGYESWNGGVGDSFLAVELFMNSFAGVSDLTLSATTASGTETDVVGPGLNLAELVGTHLVVIKYEFNSVAADVVSVYLDPTPGGAEPGLADAQVTIAASDLLITHQGAITNFVFSGGGHVPAAIDEIRWATTYEEVTPFGVAVPAPSAAALGSIALAALALRRRRCA